MTGEEIMKTTAGDVCEHCGMHVWYDDSLPGYFDGKQADPFECPKNPEGGMFHFHEVR